MLMLRLNTRMFGLARLFATLVVDWARGRFWALLAERELPVAVGFILDLSHGLASQKRPLVAERRLSLSE
jgi:hypothetical protein